MKSFYKNLDTYGQSIADEVVAPAAYAAARYEAQNDFNKELVPYVAKRTGHDHLAATVFIEVELDSQNDLKYDVYTEEAYVAGLFKSRSSYHPGYEGWEEVDKFKSMTRAQFWRMRFSGADAEHETYGGVEADWVTDNFWEGIKYVTNGWPLTKARKLSVKTKNENVSGEDATKEYIDRYISEGRYAAHIQNAINKMKK